MNPKQSRQFLHLKIQSRINEAKCKALIDDKLLSNLFSQDIQQMYFENIQNKVSLAYGHKKLSSAHKRQLTHDLELLSDTIKSDKKLLETLNNQIANLSDKERDLHDVREETILGVKEAMDYDFDSIIEDNPSSRTLNIEEHLREILPLPPTHALTEKEDEKKSISFGKVIIKTIDEVEEEREEKDEAHNNNTVHFNFIDTEENDFGNFTNDNETNLI